MKRFQHEFESGGGDHRGGDRYETPSWINRAPGVDYLSAYQCQLAGVSCSNEIGLGGEYG